MSLLCETASLSRRRLLGLSGSLVASAFIPKFARAADGRDPRFIAIILRGAMDGLSAVAPVGDPTYAALHGDLALATSGENAGLPLDSFFSLNPAMTNFARLFGKGQAAVIHATATGYRDRSHFDGQDVLESGYAGPGKTDSGWLNRAIAALPAGQRIAPPGNGLAVGAIAPLVIRGPAETLGWAPANLPKPGDDLTRRLLDLYTHTDPKLAELLRAGVDTQKLASGAMAGMDNSDHPNDMVLQARGAARLMATDDGPRIAAMAFDGWDTHENEGGAKGRLFNLLTGLDGALAEFEKTLGAAWGQTAIVVMTEFGRTAQVNGTVGTDHGTGTLAFLAGGAIKGGRVIADWPGLKPANLYQNRDLNPTTDLRAVLKGLLADQFGLSAQRLEKDIFPDSGSAKPMQGLIRT
ncbi:MAG: DUF1501 domain-containing protein [Alphaproteobacteria bacterium]|nr:DUF1501 domain-containing protein [Alphaproteobacteria bacterium]